MFGFYSPGEISLPARRDFLQQAGLGFGSVALASMLQNEKTGASEIAVARFSGSRQIDHLVIHDRRTFAGGYVGL